eukprot:CAMPEP_0119017552 /NCGR_PEP_ID=MMETSP1176-20130426/16943_1 /TAXON_ID=265551 /ORGANISM="Synedropsis recta cf, Strain CCMP1620" /LENGTH=242 /DNA_ID=CAMNT_0006971297 /DNA_START=37 /DNA_END=765 /DNA_ORIENTATION=+
MVAPRQDDNLEQYEVRHKDLDRETSTEDIIFMRKFESAWRKFLSANPHLRPRGKKAARMTVLESQLTQITTSKHLAGAELRKQLDFFLESREALEETYANEVEYANNLQKVIHDRLEKQLDGVAMSDHLMQQTVPWEHFLDTVDVKATPQYEAASPDHQGLKPSARAMALIDPEGDAEDVRLRALRMDHALLSTEIQMLQKESERIDLTSDSLEFVGKFFTENNIWGILKKQQAGQERRQQM